MNPDRIYSFPFASIPAFRITLMMILGIVLSDGSYLSLLNAGIILLICFIIWIISETIVRKKNPLAGSFLANFSYMLLIMFSLVFYSEIRKCIDELVIRPGEKINLFEWDDVLIEGVTESAGLSSSGRHVYVVRVNNTVFEDRFEWRTPYRIRLYGNHAHEDQPSLRSGDRFKSTIRIYSFPEHRNPHEFDYSGWLHSRNIAAHGELSEILKVEEKSMFGWPVIRDFVHASADQLFQRKNAAMAKALLLGHKSELTQDIRQQFSRSGLSHVMAVSGLHVGFIVAPFWVFIPVLWGSASGRWAGLLILTILLIGYAGITGFSPSVSRASLMAWFLTYGKLFHKIRNSINLTAFAAMIVLLFQPKQLFDVGFQLSFSAVFIILLLMPEAQRCIPQRYRHSATGNFMSLIIVSIIVQLGLLPILVYYFGEFSVIGPIANALVVPVLTLTIPVGLLLVLISPVSFSLLSKAAPLIELPLNWIEWVAVSFGSQQFSYVQIDGFTWTIFLVWLFMILFFASLKIEALRWKLLTCLLLSLNVTILLNNLNRAKYLDMEITFLDVGQADAIHIRTPNRKNILIDAGRWSPMSNSGESVLIPYFEHSNIESLDAVILSHPHADHIGGMPALMETMEINRIYQSNFEYDSALYKTMMEYSAKYNIEVKYPVSGEIITVDPDILILVLGPEPGRPIDRNPNNHSVVVKIIYGETEFLFTGDAEAAQERQLAGRYGDLLKTDLYKAGHHGSNTSSTATFMQYVQPEYTVASLAFRNQFRHPGREAVNRVHQYSNIQKYTSLSGAIRFTSNGTEIKKINWRD